MAKLAINGGPKIRTEPFPAQNTMGDEEKAAVQAVMDSGQLTGYLANWGPNFYGGPQVQGLEQAWSRAFNVKYAIACNSATSGLFVASMAVNGMFGLVNYRGSTVVTPGCTVVTPYSMACSATMPRATGTTPIFADIERDYYCLDLESVKSVAVPITGTIVAVSLFGQPFNPEITEWAHKQGMLVIEDAAQAVGARYKDKYAGTLGDIGVYSFNLGKHLTCGEGGMIVTDNPELAERCRLLVNHAEAVVDEMPEDYQVKYGAMVGFNLRMTELQAAIAKMQLYRRNELIMKRVRNAEHLIAGLQDVPCLEGPKIREDCTHTYYMAPFKYYTGIADGVSRERFVEAVQAELTPVQGKEGEGVPIRAGYIKPICDIPLFAHRTKADVPVCRKVQDEELIIIHRYIGPMSTARDIDDVVAAFHKVWEHRGELQ